MTKPQRILNLLLLPAVIVVAFLIVKMMIANKPERIAKTPEPVVPNVAYITSEPQTITPTISTYGNVSSYYEAQLSAQVSGEIIRIDPNFQAGRSVQAGELLLEIDPADYLALIAQEKANLATAEQALLEEAARSRLAEEDWIESGRKLEGASELTLRKPQLGAAKASVDSAKASLEKTQLDLERTKIKAPFDAIVQSRTTSLGNIVSSGSNLGTLIAKERAEVRLPLTPDQVNRLDLPMEGSTEYVTATLTTPSQNEASWKAAIKRTEPIVNTANQVIYVVGEIEAPFADPKAFLPIGAFVNASIPGKPIKQAHRIPNTSLVEDAFVWVITPENTLAKQPAERIIADDGELIVRFDTETTRLRIATRPLASFREDQAVNPIAPAN